MDFTIIVVCSFPVYCFMERMCTKFTYMYIPCNVIVEPKSTYLTNCDVCWKW